MPDRGAPLSPAPERFAAEAARVLRAGGRFWPTDNAAPPDGGLAAFINEREKLRDPSHARCPAPDEWTAPFEKPIP